MALGRLCKLLLVACLAAAASCGADAGVDERMIQVPAAGHGAVGVPAAAPVPSASTAAAVLQPERGGGGKTKPAPPRRHQPPPRQAPRPPRHQAPPPPAPRPPTPSPPRQAPRPPRHQAPPSPAPRAPTPSPSAPAPATAMLPAAVDWRVHGAVTVPKDEGQELGASWAFAAVAAIEGAQQISKGKLVALSAQQLVDCANAQHFTPREALAWVLKNGGITSDAQYPYTGKQGSCSKASIHDFAATITSYSSIDNVTELALMAAVARQPVAVRIAVQMDQFRAYEPGSIYAGPCADKLNHALTVVGYGTSNKGEAYWIAKNSFGSGWGNEGYVFIKRGGDDTAQGGLCGIAKRAVFPTVTAG